MPLDYEIATRTLANGLRVHVAPDPGVPIVAVNLWVGVGSRHERAGRTGFAHLFEHLMFQGSREVAEGEHFAAMLGQGARLNATTWFDRTNYFETVPTGAMELALWLEADRHGHLLDAVTQDNLDNQRDVVKEEKRQRYDNRPYGNAMVDVYATVFPQGHPYHHPTIGSMADLDAASLDDVHEFYRRHYGPNNTVLTLVGDVTPEEGFAAAERYFGSLPAVELEPEPVAAPLAPLEQPARCERTEDVPSDRIWLAFRLPAAHTREFYAAELALDLLAGLATSRLYRRLVRREQIATHVSQTAMGLVAGTSLGLLSVEVAEGRTVQEVEEAVCAELDRLIAEPPTDDELATVRADLERWWLQALASHDERADLISHYSLLHNDPEHINRYLDEQATLTADDVIRVAQTWLRPQSRAAVIYRRETS
ncbi:insulinase family protein [Calidifontibacter sp. DB0510]|uniref:Insulinase family protein n=1 Tax=Metallococcus carri TaxID=1656884 RepID=A0A967B1S5_9MICO|nr:pitrilysin family protein [Metallococcus carri]NHN56437.1 insulinase family protein [Metallococcus carri]NOP36061.1 insulinase family protein [Calidifontibacter sp. DB2511S]